MEFDGRLIEAYARVEKLPSYLHLPVQSGFGHGACSHETRLHRGRLSQQDRAPLRKARPGISIASDFIVGFPGETEEEFAQTLALVEDIGFDQSFSFMYSARPGTPAAGMEDPVPQQVKLERLQRLQALITRQARRISRSMVHSSQRVLVERRARRGEGLVAGRTGNNRWVNFDGPVSLIGRFVDVVITEALPNSLRGRLLPEIAGRLRLSRALNSESHTMEVVLRPADNGALANLCGELDKHLRQIEQGLGVRISNKGNRFRGARGTGRVPGRARRR